MQVVDDEMEPEVVISLLREKIVLAKRRVTEIRLDMQVIESIPAHSQGELDLLQKNLDAARTARDAYQGRLDAITTVAREQAAG